MPAENQLRAEGWRPWTDLEPPGKLELQRVLHLPQGRVWEVVHVRWRWLQLGSLDMPHICSAQHLSYHAACPGWSLGQMSSGKPHRAICPSSKLMELLTFTASAGCRY